MDYFPSYNGLSPFMDPTFGLTFIPLVLALALWTIVIKGFALWHAARNSHKVWFVVLLVVNTVGILEVIYLLWLRSRKPATIAESNTPSA